jgi:hypothetical protein
MQLLPNGIRRRLGTIPLLIGVDPIWAGLHRYEDTGDGRSRRNCSHVSYDFGQALPASLRETTVVLANGDADRVLVVLHELGHVLDQRIGFDRPAFKPLDAYAATHHVEAFATAFQAWATRREVGLEDAEFHNWKELMECDPSAATFFDRLA